MHDKLKEILVEKEREVANLRERMSVFDKDAPPLRNFRDGVHRKKGATVIAEIKFASPSAGVICKQTDVTDIGRMYEECGAGAISLITDKTFFGGDLSRLPLLKGAVNLPVLRKDFIIDELQIMESLIHGADAVLLIARILTSEKLTSLLSLCRKTGLSALTEVHDKDDLQKAIDCGADIIGINNRDLDTFDLDLNTTRKLAPLVPDHCTVVCESGILGGETIKSLTGLKINAFLVGSAIMGSRSMSKTLRELVDAADESYGES